MNDTPKTARQQRMLRQRALQRLEDRVALRVGIQARRAPQSRNDAHDVRRRLADGEFEIAGIPQGLLDERNPMTGRESRKDLLRPLPHEIPPQMGMNDDRKF